MLVSLLQVDLFFYTDPEEAKEQEGKRLWLLLTMAPLQNTLLQGLTAGALIGVLVKLQLHLLAFQLLVQTGLLLQVQLLFS
jgi:hypothetical protein